MPYRTGITGPPTANIDGTWPHGSPTNIEAHYAQTIARNLTEAIGARSLRSVAAQCGIHHTTLAAIIAGDRWGDLVTLARLEHGLGTTVWPTNTAS